MSHSPKKPTGSASAHQLSVRHARVCDVLTDAHSHAIANRGREVRRAREHDLPVRPLGRGGVVEEVEDEVVDGRVEELEAVERGRLVDELMREVQSARGVAAGGEERLARLRERRRERKRGESKGVEGKHSEGVAEVVESYTPLPFYTAHSYGTAPLRSTPDSRHPYADEDECCMTSRCRPVPQSLRRYIRGVYNVPRVCSHVERDLRPGSPSAIRPHRLAMDIHCALSNSSRHEGKQLGKLKYS
jgi:hypothetical protein